MSKIIPVHKSWVPVLDWVVSCLLRKEAEKITGDQAAKIEVNRSDILTQAWEIIIRQDEADKAMWITESFIEDTDGRTETGRHTYGSDVTRPPLRGERFVDWPDAEGNFWRKGTKPNDLKNGKKWR